MAKSKRKPATGLRAKTAKHKAAATKLAKELSNTFLVNRLMGRSVAAGLDAFDPFVFVITIEVNPTITITGANVNGSIAGEDDFKKKDGKLVCKVEALVSTFTFLLIINAEGEVGAGTTFNVTCDDAKVFEEDQEIVITPSGRGSFSNPKVPLP